MHGMTAQESRRPPNGRSSPPAPPPSYPPTPCDWQDHRDLITRLYIDEDQSLPQVMSCMVDEHRFRATRKMYKQRFSQWKLRKNYRRVEKEAVLSKVAAEGVGVLDGMRLNGRRVDMNRLRRFQREHPRERDVVAARKGAARVHRVILPNVAVASEAAADADDGHVAGRVMQQIRSGESDRETGKALVISASRFAASPPPLGAVLRSHPGAESVLFHADIFLRDTIARKVSQSTYTARECPSYFFNNLNRICRSRAAPHTDSLWLNLTWVFLNLTHGFRRTTATSSSSRTIADAFYVLRRVCDPVFVRDFLRRSAETPLFLGKLVAFAGSRRWTRFAGLRAHLLGYFAAMARAHLGPCHPATRMLEQLGVEDTAREAAELVLDWTFRRLRDGFGRAHFWTVVAQRHLVVGGLERANAHAAGGGIGLHRTAQELGIDQVRDDILRQLQEDDVDEAKAGLWETAEEVRLHALV